MKTTIAISALALTLTGCVSQCPQSGKITSREYAKSTKWAICPVDSIYATPTLEWAIRLAKQASEMSRTLPNQDCDDEAIEVAGIMRRLYAKSSMCGKREALAVETVRGKLNGSGHAVIAVLTSDNGWVIIEAYTGRLRGKEFVASRALKDHDRISKSLRKLTHTD